MKTISTILALGLCASSPLAAGEETTPSISVQQETRFQLGSEAIASIRTAYEAGQYDEFLTEMNDAYKAAKEGNELEGLIEIRKESAQYTIPQDKLVSGFEAIQKEKNSDLLKSIADDKESLFAQKVRSAATPVDSSTADALKVLSPFRTMAPGTGANSDENALIEIDLEAQYKTIHLDSIAASGQSVGDRKAKQIVLEMERMDQMVVAATSFTDEALKSAVAKAASSQDERLVKMYDMSDLNALAKGRIKPQSVQEERAASIVANAQAKFSDLNRELLSETAQK